MPRKEHTTTDNLRELRLLWLAEQRGILTRIARETGFSASKIQDNFYGKVARRDPVVIAKLAEAGAPGFAEEVNHAA